MKIVISGDSFTYGQGCPDRVVTYAPKNKMWEANFETGSPASTYSWVSLLQQHYPEHQIINLSQPGSDNMYISMSIIDNIVDADIVFFAGTAVNRMQISHFMTREPAAWVIGAPISVLPHMVEYEQATELFLKHLYSEEYFITMSVAAIVAASGVSAIRNIDFLYSFPIYGVGPIEKASTMHNNYIRRTAEVIGTTVPPLFGYFNAFFGNNVKVPVSENPYLYSDGHANEIGHKYYFEHEILPVFKQLIDRRAVCNG